MRRKLNRMSNQKFIQTYRDILEPLAMGLIIGISATIGLIVGVYIALN